MSALYFMRYVGVPSAAPGTLYIGRQTILGVDAGGARYVGSFSETRGRMNVDITLLMPKGGVLITGANAPAGSKYRLSGDWPVEPADGFVHRMNFDGRVIQVGFERIGYVP